jgi:hypothetical protein
MNLLSLNPINDKPTTGRALARKLRGASPALRAIHALSLTNGDAISGLTHSQAAKVADVGVEAISIVANATPVELEHLKRGWVSLRGVRRAHAVRLAQRRNRPSAADIENVIRADPDAVLAVLDRLTAPDQVAATA